MSNELISKISKGVLPDFRSTKEPTMTIYRSHSHFKSSNNQRRIMIFLQVYNKSDPTLDYASRLVFPLQKNATRTNSIDFPTWYNIITNTVRQTCKVPWIMNQCTSKYGYKTFICHGLSKKKER